jgi:hypothetical protein
MTPIELYEEFDQFYIDNKEFWPEGLISIDIQEKIRLQFTLNRQSESFFKDNATTFYNSGDGYIAIFGNFKVWLIKQDNNE